MRAPPPPARESLKAELRAPPPPRESPKTKPAPRRCKVEGQGEPPRSSEPAPWCKLAAAQVLKSAVPRRCGLCLTHYQSRSAGLRSLYVLWKRAKKNRCLGRYCI
ncbi:unnamed protein product [Coccothraustes coccothraustes]